MPSARWLYAPSILLQAKHSIITDATIWPSAGIGTLLDTTSLKGDIRHISECCILLKFILFVIGGTSVGYSHIRHGSFTGIARVYHPVIKSCQIIRWVISFHQLEKLLFSYRDHMQVSINKIIKKEMAYLIFHDWIPIPCKQHLIILCQHTNQAKGNQTYQSSQVHSNTWYDRLQWHLPKSSLKDCSLKDWSSFDFQHRLFMSCESFSLQRLHYHMVNIIGKTRTTRRPAFWGYPPTPHDYPYYWPVHIRSQVKTRWKPKN